MSIPDSWLQIINTQSFNLNTANNIFLVNGHEVSPDQFTSRFCYNTLIKLNQSEPAGVKFWKEQNLEINWPVTWINIHRNFKSPNNVEIDFKIAHNIIWNKVKLHRIGKVDNPSCPVCGVEPECTIHLFVTCHKLDYFIILIKEMLNDILTFDINHNDFIVLILFGVQSTSKSIPHELLNIILSCARHTIYIRRNAVLDNPDRNIDLVKMYRSNLAQSLLHIKSLYAKHIFIKKFILPSFFINIQLDKISVDV